MKISYSNDVAAGQCCGVSVKFGSIQRLISRSYVDCGSCISRGLRAGLSQVAGFADQSFSVQPGDIGDVGLYRGEDIESEVTIRSGLYLRIGTTRFSLRVDSLSFHVVQRSPVRSLAADCDPFGLANV